MDAIQMEMNKLVLTIKKTFPKWKMLPFDLVEKNIVQYLGICVTFATLPAARMMMREAYIRAWYSPVIKKVAEKREQRKEDIDLFTVLFERNYEMLAPYMPGREPPPILNMFNNVAAASNSTTIAVATLGAGEAMVNATATAAA